MSRYKQWQQQLIDQFTEIVSNSNKREAAKLLAKADWDLNSAIETYMSSVSAQPEADEKKIINLFNSYAEVNGDEGKLVMMQTGIDKFFTDLGIDLEESNMSFIVAWKLKFTDSEQVEKDTFVNGLKSVRCDSIDRLKRKLPEFERDYKTAEGFKEFYNFLFDYVRTSSSGTRSNISRDVAEILWDQCLGQEKFFYLNEWKAFLQKNKYNAISKDTWYMLLSFAEDVKRDPKLTRYNPEGEMPWMIDEFVQWLRDNGTIPALVSEEPTNPYDSPIYY